jgi:MoxR-like ATPase
MSEYLTPQEEMVQSLYNIETSEELKEFLKDAIEIQRDAEKTQEKVDSYMPGVPLIFGKPGMGKTSVVNQFAEEEGYIVVEVNCAMDVEERFRGIPYPLEKKSRKKDEPPVEMVWVSSEVQKSLKDAYEELEKRRKNGEELKGIILFLDDMHYASENLSPLLQELLTKKTVAGKKLPPNTYVVLAANYGEATMAQDIAAPIMTRVLPIRYEPPAKKAFESYERFAREVLASTPSAISLSALEFFRLHPEIFEQKEERNKMTGTIRTVSYLLTSIRSAEKRKENGEISNEEFVRAVKRFSNYLPPEYKDKFLRFYFSVNNLQLAEFVEQGGKVNPVEILNSIKESLIEQGLEPEREPVDRYVRATLAQYFRSLINEYVEDLREAVKAKNPDKVGRVLVKYAERLHRVASFHNTLEEKKGELNDEFYNRIVAGVWNAVSVSAVAEIRRIVEQAINIYTYADDTAPDKVMMKKLWRTLKELKESDSSVAALLESAGLDAISEFSEPTPSHAGAVVFPPFYHFLVEEQFLRNGQKTTISEVVGSDLLSDLVLSSRKRVNEDYAKIKQGELDERLKKLRRKYNSVRL